MIDDTDILKAVRAQLKAAWQDVDVNLDDVQRSFRLPCFFLRFFELDSPQMVYSRSLKRSCTLHIDYFSQKNRNSAIELYKVRKRLRELFTFGLQVGDRVFNFDGISTETNGKDADILSATLSFSFYDVIAGKEEDPPTIGNIEQDIELLKE